MNTEGILTVIFGAATTLFVGWQVIKRIFPWVEQDMKFIYIYVQSLRMLDNYRSQTPQYTVVDRYVELARDHPDKKYIYFEDEIWTHREANDMSSKIAKVFKKVGAKKTYTIALMMIPRPEFIATLFGIAKTGAAAALINYNIRGKSLLHCLLISECKSLIISNDKEIIQAIADIKNDLAREGIRIYVLGETPNDVVFEKENLYELMELESAKETPRNWRSDVTLQDSLGYVYTSGTTGLPKAAVISHSRAWLSCRFMTFVKCTKDDVIYSPLPLYHGAAGLIGVLGCVYVGCSIVIRRKFSASQFWPDCRKYNATLVQYIGETMRYICDQPPHKDDKNHKVRAALGNGLRPNVWKTFLRRFGDNIRIYELYAATEGNVAFLNLDNHIGSVGMLSPLLQKMGPTLIKYNRELDMPCRDRNGRCIEVPTGTAGLLVGKITPRTEFSGYRGNKKQTEKKILRDVFKKGDMYFNSGDLLRKDHDHHLYFVDRVGDTFRWKGENVATNEVSDVMCEAPSVKEANVYGVEVEGLEGRAGMMVAILKPGRQFDCKGVYTYAQEHLASYARPIFIRIQPELELTGTFKQKKVELVKEGYDLEKVKSDPVFFMDTKEKRYVPLTREIVDNIRNKTIRI